MHSIVQKNAELVPSTTVAYSVYTKEVGVAIHTLQVVLCSGLNIDYKHNGVAIF